MSAVPEYVPGRPVGPPAALPALLAAAEAAVDRLAVGSDLAAMADGEAATVMGALTTLVARLDGLRVAVTHVAAERGLYGHRGARNLTGWLRTDARAADDAWKLARLAAASPDLPKITRLLAAGTVSLSQAATACWQIGQLPELPRVPGDAESPATAATAGPPDIPGASGGADDPGADGDARGGDGDARGGDGDARGGDAGLGDPSAGEERWAGLWRLGDVHAAADELFSQVLPGLDSAQLRQLGAHLREAADPERRAGEDHGDFARRGLRISRSLAGCGELTGRLHAEAAEQVIAAFEELGAKTGPGDTRTKTQRWADALTRLCATATGSAADPLTGDPRSGAARSESARPGAAQPQPAQHEPAEAGAAAEAEAAGLAGPEAITEAEPVEPVDDRPGTPNAAHGPGHHHHHGVQPDGDDAMSGAGAATYENGRGVLVPAGYQRPRLIVTVPLVTLLGQPLAPGATVLGAGTPLTGEAARRLACDAQVIRLVTSPSPRHPTTSTHSTTSSTHHTSTGPPGGSNWPGTGPPGGGPPASGPPGGGLPDGGGPPGNGTGRAGTGGRAGPPGRGAHPGGTATTGLTDRLAAGLAQLPPPLAGPPAVLDLGRASPGWTARQRDALAAQHGGRCAYPGCGGPIDVVHHLRPWADGGPTSISNGLPLCLFHHWLVHEGGWRVSKHPGATVTALPPPPGWRPGTIYRHGKPLPEHAAHPNAEAGRP